MHEINLQRAWERHVSPDQCIAWVRWFQKPSNIGSVEQVFLVADPCRLRTMWLNGNSLVGSGLYEEGTRVYFRTSCVSGIASFFVSRTGLYLATRSNGSVEITSGRLASDRVVLPIEFGKVGLKIG